MRWAIAALFLLAGCRGPYDAAWRTVDAIQKARDLTSKQLAASARAKHTECKTKYGSKTKEFAECIKAHREALNHWRKIARPAIRSACAITVSGLQVAEKVENKQLAWLELLKPAACALMRSAKAWGIWLPDKGQTILGALAAWEGLVCE